MSRSNRKQYKKSERRVLNISLALNIAISVVFTILLVFSIFLVRNRILQNTEQMATSLAKSYAQEEENRLDQYEAFLNFAGGYIKGNPDIASEPASLRSWFRMYSDSLSESIGEMR